MTEPAVGAARPAGARGLLAIGSAGLGIEALVVLLAAPAVLSLQRGHVSVAAVTVLLVVFALLVVGATVLRRPWGRTFGSALQPIVFLTGIVTWPMFIIGVVFGGIWIYYLRLWRLINRESGSG